MTNKKCLTFVLVGAIIEKRGIALEKGALTHIYSFILDICAYAKLKNKYTFLNFSYGIGSEPIPYEAIEYNAFETYDHGEERNPHDFLPRCRITSEASGNADSHQTEDDEGGSDGDDDVGTLHLNISFHLGAFLNPS